VIVQISSIAIPKTKIVEYLEHVRRNLLPAYNKAPGLDAVHFLHRSLVAYDELVTISVWQSEEALRHFTAGSDPDVGSRELAGIEFEPRTYKLVLSRNIQPPSGGDSG
jgi:heme-degrading monooxygenase HmoA